MKQARAKIALARVSSCGAAGNRIRLKNRAELREHETRPRESTSEDAKTPAETRHLLTASTSCTR